MLSAAVGLSRVAAVDELTRRARAARDGGRGARRAGIESSRVDGWHLDAAAC
jgi:hypothetical protein